MAHRLEVPLLKLPVGVTLGDEGPLIFFERGVLDFNLFLRSRLSSEFLAASEIESAPRRSYVGEHLVIVFTSEIHSRAPLTVLLLFVVCYLKLHLYDYYSYPWKRHYLTLRITLPTK